MKKSIRYFVTGATGQLGRLIVTELAERVGADNVVAGARSPERASDLGVEVRRFDYSEAETLVDQLKDADRLLLISSSEVGARTAQHKAVLEAAKRAGVSLLAYTSVLRADTSELSLAQEHRETERAIEESGLNHILLRNGWYTENLTAGVSNFLNYGVVSGCSGEGRISAASREDFAEAAVIALTKPQPSKREVLELAGDTSFTKAELAEELTKLSGKPVSYLHLTQQQFKAQLIDAGLPKPFADLLADSDSATAKGALEHNGKELSTLLGRPTTDWKESLKLALS